MVVETVIVDYLEGLVCMKKKLKVAFNSPVTLWFVIICFLALLADIATGGWANNYLFSVYDSSLLDPLTYVRVVGYVFGHASWDHFMGNMMSLLLVGPLLEEKYGSKMMIKVMLVTAVVTGIFSMALFPDIQLLGASGIVFAFILLSSITGVKEREIPLTFIMVAVLYLGGQIYDGIMIDDDVSNFGHVLGGICGSIIGYYNINKNAKNNSPAPVAPVIENNPLGGMPYGVNQYNDGYNYTNNIYNNNNNYNNGNYNNNNLY